MQLKIATFNLRYGTADDGENSWDHRKTFVVDELKLISPDIACFQEVLDFQRAYLQEQFPGFCIVGVGREDGKTGSEFSPIMFNRAQYILAECGTFWLSSTPEVPGSKSWNTACTRICTWARLIDTATCSGFYVFNTHLDHKSHEAQLNGIKLIIQRIAARTFPEPYILTGDLNARESSPVIEHLKSDKALVPFKDTYRAIHPGETNIFTCTGFQPDTTPDNKIDYVFASPDFRTLAADIDRTKYNDRYPSDHCPVWAEVTLEP